MTETEQGPLTSVSIPGETIIDILTERGWTAAQFAERMGYTPKHVNELLHGRASITADTALRLESVLGSTAQFWLNREVQYREALARREAHAGLQDQGEWLRTLPIKQMVEWKWIEKADDTAAQAAVCLKFFGVSSVPAWQETYSKPIEALGAFRASNRHAMKLGSVVAWLRKGELEAAARLLKPWDKAAFKAALPEIRKLTRETDPQKFLPALAKQCAEVGVAFVHLRAPEGCPVNGATKFLSPEKALLMLSFRHLREDAFWFSFFHEAGHLILHPKRTMFLEVPKAEGAEEREADQHAEDLLVPAASRPAMDQLGTPSAIRNFADSIGISAGIVVGQLHHRGVPFNRFNFLIQHYRWVTG